MKMKAYLVMFHPQGLSAELDTSRCTGVDSPLQIFERTLECVFSWLTLESQRLRDMKVHKGLLMESWQLSGMECSHIITAALNFQLKTYYYFYPWSDLEEQ